MKKPAYDKFPHKSYKQVYLCIVQIRFVLTFELNILGVTTYGSFPSQGISTEGEVSILN